MSCSRPREASALWPAIRLQLSGCQLSVVARRRAAERGFAGLELQCLAAGQAAPGQAQGSAQLQRPLTRLRAAPGLRVELAQLRAPVAVAGLAGMRLSLEPQVVRRALEAALQTGIERLQRAGDVGLQRPHPQRLDVGSARLPPAEVG